jgi:hypothetical protein
MTGMRVGGPRPPQAEDPDRRALELASMCDLVESGVALSISATYPRPADPADIVASRPRSRSVPTVSPFTSGHLGMVHAMDDVLILIVFAASMLVTYGLLVLADRIR